MVPSTRATRLEKAERSIREHFADMPTHVSIALSALKHLEKGDVPAFHRELGRFGLYAHIDTLTMCLKHGVMFAAELVDE